MSAAERRRQFVDTNVLVYAHDATAGAKTGRAAKLLDDLWESGEGCLSLQVLQEFFVNITRKVSKPLPRSAAANIIEKLGAGRPFATTKDLLAAIEIHDRGGSPSGRTRRPKRIPAGMQDPLDRGPEGRGDLRRRRVRNPFADPLNGEPMDKPAFSTASAPPFARGTTPSDRRGLRRVGPALRPLPRQAPPGRDGEAEINAFLTDSRSRRRSRPPPRTRPLAPLPLPRRPRQEPGVAGRRRPRPPPRAPSRRPLPARSGPSSPPRRVPRLVATLLYGSGLRLMEASASGSRTSTSPSTRSSSATARGRRTGGRCCRLARRLPPPPPRRRQGPPRRGPEARPRRDLAPRGARDEVPGGQPPVGLAVRLSRPRLKPGSRTGRTGRTTFTRRPSRRPSRRLSGRRASRRRPAATPSGTPSRPTSSRAATTSGRSRSCSDTAMSAPP